VPEEEERVRQGQTDYYRSSAVDIAPALRHKVDQLHSVAMAHLIGINERYSRCGPRITPIMRFYYGAMAEC
jgi:hypothetical protein